MVGVIIITVTNNANKVNTSIAIHKWPKCTVEIISFSAVAVNATASLTGISYSIPKASRLFMNHFLAIYTKITTTI